MGRIFRNMAEAVNEIERDIMEMGILVHPHTMQNKNVKDDPAYDTLETQNYSFSILDTSDKDSCVENVRWCREEFMERIDPSTENPGEAWKLRESTWKEFLNKDGTMDYTYSERMNSFAQVELVIKELTENPDTRQALIHINFPEDCLGWRQIRIPCSVYYQFMIRRGALDIIYNMRSSDYATHFKNDIWLAATLRDYIAERVKIPTGIFSMNIGSLHIYRSYGNHKHVF